MALGISTVVVIITAASLACLVLATISAPASSLSLAEAEGIRYGVLGYCFSDNSTCIVGTPSYKPSTLTSLTDWKMDDTARDTLAKILIVTPVAAGLSLISLFFNLLLHFKAIGGSFAVCLISFIFTLLTFFASAITVIVTFMLFYPHVKWTGWILIAPGILSLITVPLSFFALRTLPSQSLDEEYEDNKNLTDLSDGDIFKASGSYKVDSYPPEPSFSNISLQKPNGYSIKINNDDSTTSLDKVSIHDTSKNNNSGYGGYQAYKSNTIGHVSDNHELDDGAPHIVSSNDYLKAGSVRSEAPRFDAKSVKPEFNASSHLPSQYTTAQPEKSDSRTVAAGQQSEAFPSNRPGFTSSKTSAPHPNSSHPSAANNNGPNFAFSSNHSPSDNSGLNVAVPSRGASVSDYVDDNGEIINDDDSDFTSVSQRAANPKYFRSIQNYGPALLSKQQSYGLQQHYTQAGHPQQAYSQQPYNPQPLQYHQSSSAPQPGFPQQSYSTQGNSNQGFSSHKYDIENNSHQNYPSQGHYQQGYGSGGLQYQRVSRAPPNDTSAALLNANPDFSIGPSSGRSAPISKRSNPNASGSYKPAYRRVNNANSGALPPASLSADSPYNFR